MASLLKNVASQNLTFALITTAGAAATGKTVSVFVTKDNGAQGSGGGTVTEAGNGQYNYAPTQSETNATDVGFLFTATGCVPENLDFHTDLADSNGLLKVDVEDWKGTAVGSPATGGIPDVNAKNINNVATTSVTTINANQGTTQPVNFTGTAGSALVKGDAIDINSVAASSVTTINASLGTTQPINFTGTAGSALVKGDAIDINSVAASSVTTINASVGTTQPVNFTGTAGSALVKSDMVDVAGSAVSAASAQIGANVVNIAGSAVSSTTAQLGVNVVKYNNHTAVTDANNLPEVDVEDINGIALAAQALAQSTQSICWGTASGGTTATVVVGTLNNPSSLTASGQLIGRTIIFLGNSGTGGVQAQASNITASTTGATPTITFTAMTTAPANGDVFVIL